MYQSLMYLQQKNKQLKYLKNYSLKYAYLKKHKFGMSPNTTLIRQPLCLILVLTALCLQQNRTLKELLYVHPTHLLCKSVKRSTKLSEARLIVARLIRRPVLTKTLVET